MTSLKKKKKKAYVLLVQSLLRFNNFPEPFYSIFGEIVDFLPFFFKSLICYNIASLLCFDLLAQRHIDSWASLIAQLVKNLPAMQETLVQFLGQEDPWRRDRLPTPVFLDFPCGSTGKESACNKGDLGCIPGLGRSPGNILSNL